MQHQAPIVNVFFFQPAPLCANDINSQSCFKVPRNKHLRPATSISQPVSAKYQRSNVNDCCDIRFQEKKITHIFSRVDPHHVNVYNYYNICSINGSGSLAFFNSGSPEIRSHSKALFASLLKSNSNLPTALTFNSTHRKEEVLSRYHFFAIFSARNIENYKHYKEVFI
jgi:hypothetical protein